MSGILRLIGGGLLALIACYVGVLIKRRYKTREQFYRSAREYTQSVAGELSYKKTPIPELARKFAEGRKGEFEKALLIGIDAIKEGADFSELLSKLDLSFLKADEKKELAAFFELNKLTLADQLAEVEHFRGMFDSKCKACEGETKRLGGMYFKLCALLGLALLILLA